VITYFDILNSIKKCEGAFVTIIKNSGTINDDFIYSIIEDLKSEYAIEYNPISNDNVKVKTISIFNYSKLYNVGDINFDENLITIIIRNYNETSNTQVFGESGADYFSSLVFLLKNGKLKVLKSRYSDIEGTFDVSKIVRKFKLKKLKRL
jgi:hypothetical protein